MREYTEQELVRRQKARKLREKNIDPFGHRFDAVHGHPAYAPLPAASASAFCGAWSRCGCQLDCWAARHCRGRFVPSGETGGRLNSEDTRMEVAHGEKLWMKYFHLQVSDL